MDSRISFVRCVQNYFSLSITSITFMDILNSRFRLRLSPSQASSCRIVGIRISVLICIMIIVFFLQPFCAVVHLFKSWTKISKRALSTKIFVGWGVRKVHKTLPGPSTKCPTENGEKLTYSPAVGCNWLCLAGVYFPLFFWGAFRWRTRYVGKPCP